MNKIFENLNNFHFSLWKAIQMSCQTLESKLAFSLSLLQSGMTSAEVADNIK